MSRYREFQKQLHEASFNSAISYNLLTFGLIWLIYTCALRGLLSEFSFTSNIRGAAWNFISSSQISPCEYCTQLFNWKYFKLQWNLRRSFYGLASYLALTFRRVWKKIQYTTKFSACALAVKLFWLMVKSKRFLSSFGDNIYAGCRNRPRGRNTCLFNL